MRSPAEQEKFLRHSRFEQSHAWSKPLVLIASLRKKESEDKWIRYGVRLLSLIVLFGACLVLAAYFDQMLGEGSISLITRLVGLFYIILSILIVPLATLSLCVGLIRRYLLK